MDWTLDFDGSEVQVTQVDDHQVRLRFSAALVRQRTANTRDEAGHVKGIELLFDHAKCADAELPLCMGALSDSSLRLDGASHRHLPVPFAHSGQVEAEFNFRSGTTLRLSATSVRCQAPEGGARFLTSYAC